MEKQNIHRLHYLLNQALYCGFEGTKMPKHLEWVEEALMLVKEEIKKEEREYEMGT